MSQKVMPVSTTDKSQYLTSNQKVHIYLIIIKGTAFTEYNYNL